MLLIQYVLCAMRICKCYIFLIVLFICLVVAIAFMWARINMKTETEIIVLPSIESVPKEYWAKLAEKKIFFGHKSVGYNVLDGITDIMREHDYVRLKIVETDDPADFDEPIFAHAAIGKNTKPQSKILAFKNIMDSGVGDKVDMAFFKFCYVDVMRDSDPQQIFDNYDSELESLKARYPEVAFLHVTVPVCSTPRTAERVLKESVRFLIGKPGVLDDNLKRQRYNSLLNQRYAKAEKVFDLAFAESISLNGLRCYGTKGGERVYIMFPGYTHDGGHLNPIGRKKIAEQLLITLAKMANE